LYVELCHSPSGRTNLQFLNKGVEHALSTLDVHFHSAILKISNTAHKIKLSRRSGRKRTKPNALYMTMHIDMGPNRQVISRLSHMLPLGMEDLTDWVLLRSGNILIPLHIGHVFCIFRA